MEIAVMNNIFLENAKCFATTHALPIATEINKAITYIIYGAHCNAFLLLQLKERCFCRYIVLNTENYKSICFKNKYYRTLLQTSQVLDYTPQNRLYLKHNMDINIMGFHWFQSLPNTIESLERSIDFCFVGAESEKRLSVEKLMKETYPQKNIMFVYPTEPVDLTMTFLQSKVVVNIPFYDDNWEMHRVHKALSCGCRVLSHLPKDESIVSLYEDYVYFTEDYISSLNIPKKKYEDLVKHYNENVDKHVKWLLKMQS